jgi:Tfp pilus assembly protein PilO
MDGQMIINLLAGSALAVIGWFARQLWDAVERLKSDVKDIEICLPSNYVRKQDMSAFKHDMEARFDKIDNTLEKMFEKLDNKADK